MTISRVLDIKIRNCDKLPTTLCQPCVAKVEELDHFLNNSHETQKILSVQYGVALDVPLNEGETLTEQSLMIEPNIAMAIKEDLPEVVAYKPTTQSTTLSADKLLETAIKDTCILSEQDSDDSDSMDAMTDDQSASDEKVNLFNNRRRRFISNSQCFRILSGRGRGCRCTRGNQSLRCPGNARN